MAGAEGGSACAAPPAVAAVDEEAPAPPPAAVPADAAPSAMRAFLRLVAVQQTLLLLVGSLFYDAGSIAYLVDLLPSALLFIIATSLFIFGLGLDVLEIRDNARKAREMDGPFGTSFGRRLWLRWAALVVNVGGGVVTIVGSVIYLQASELDADYATVADELRVGNVYFAVGIWAFCVGFTAILYDVRAALMDVARAQGVASWHLDETFWVLVAYLFVLVLFGVASTLYIFQGDTIQAAGTALFVVSNVAFTLLNAGALVMLWREHAKGYAPPGGADAVAPAAGEDAAPPPGAAAAAAASALAPPAPGSPSSAGYSPRLRWVETASMRLAPAWFRRARLVAARHAAAAAQAGAEGGEGAAGAPGQPPSAGGGGGGAPAAAAVAAAAAAAAAALAGGGSRPHTPPPPPLPPPDTRDVLEMAGLLSPAPRSSLTGAAALTPRRITELHALAAGAEVDAYGAPAGGGGGGGGERQGGGGGRLG